MTSRRSELQLDILLYLDNFGPQDNIAAIARDLEYLRPAVSRSLHTMYRKGWVDRDGKTWSVSEWGTEVIEEWREDTMDKLRQYTASIRRLTRAIKEVKHEVL